MLLRGDIMGYAIQYATGVTKKYPHKKRRGKPNKKTLLGLIVVTVIAVTLVHIPAVRRLVLPGDPEMTERAIIKMVDEWQAGESLSEAVTTFCHEVINGGLQN